MDIGGLGPYPIERITFSRPSSSRRIFLYFRASLSNSIEGIGGSRSYPSLDELKIFGYMLLRSIPFLV
jgi:hypothetical protein